jgi:catalase
LVTTLQATILPTTLPNMNGHSNGTNGASNGASNGVRTGDIFRSYQEDRNATSQETIYTTSNGVPYPHPYEVQRVGENGPLLLQDHHLVDLLSHFDREVCLL